MYQANDEIYKKELVNIMTQTQLKTQTPIYYPLTNQDVIEMASKMTPAQQRIFLYVKTLTGPWSDRTVEVKVAEIAQKLHMDRSTVSRALNYLKREGFIDYELLSIAVRVSSPANWRDRHAQECDRHAHPPIYKDRARVLDLKDYKIPQTGGEKIFQEEESPPEFLASLENELESLYKAKDMAKDQSSAVVEFHQKKIEVESRGGPVEFCQEDIEVETQGAVEFCQEDIAAQVWEQPVKLRQEDIKVKSGGPVEFHQKHISVTSYPASLKHLPHWLLQKIRNLGIPFDDRIVGILRECHQSQILGALRHMEEMAEEIHSPRDFFAFKAPKMPIEALGVREPVRTAADFLPPAGYDPSQKPPCMVAEALEKAKAANQRNAAKAAAYKSKATQGSLTEEEWISSRLPGKR